MKMPKRHLRFTLAGRVEIRVDMVHTRLTLSIMKRIICIIDFKMGKSRLMRWMEASLLCPMWYSNIAMAK